MIQLIQKMHLARLHSLPRQFSFSSEPSKQSILPLHKKSGEIHLFPSQEYISEEQVAPKIIIKCRIRPNIQIQLFNVKKWYTVNFT